MPTNHAPATEAGASMQHPDGTADPVVHVIQSHYHYRDADNYLKTDTELLDEEGWFADAAAAAARCDQLNAKNRVHYDTTMASQKRTHDGKINAAKLQNREAAAIRAAGMKKADVRVPRPFVPEPYERFLSKSNYTLYEAIEIRRSEHDGILRAGGVSTEENAAEIAASSTA